MSLFKIFAMFQMRLLYHENKEDIVGDIDIQCKNCHGNTGLHSKDKTIFQQAQKGFRGIFSGILQHQKWYLVYVPSIMKIISS